MRLLSIPTVVGRHDGPDTRLYGGGVGRQIKPPEGGFVAFSVALVNAVARTAVTDVVLGAGQHRTGLR